MLPKMVETSIATKQTVPKRVGRKKELLRLDARTARHEAIAEDIQKGTIFA